MIRSHMMWNPTMRSAGVTTQGPAAGVPARSLSARFVRMAAVAGISAMILFGQGIGAVADAASPRAKAYSEYLVKAAFLYNFARFTEWPSGTYAHPSAPLMVCVLGKDPFGPMLDSIAGKRINGRPVAVSRLVGVEKAGQCQVLFIGESEEERVPGIVDYLAGRPVLTVCDAPGCTRFKGIIHLKVVSERIRFAIDTDCAKTAGLKFSSKLLALAEKFASKTKTKTHTQVTQHQADARALPGQGRQLSRR